MLCNVRAIVKKLSKALNRLCPPSGTFVRRTWRLLSKILVRMWSLAISAKSGHIACCIQNSRLTYALQIVLEKWTQLTDEQRKIYEARADKDLERYERQLKPKVEETDKKSKKRFGSMHPCDSCLMLTPFATGSVPRHRSIRRARICSSLLSIVIPLRVVQAFKRLCLFA